MAAPLPPATVLRYHSVGGLIMGRLSVAVISTISAAAFTHIASAADLPMKAPVKAPDAVATNWTGVYVNGGLGYGIWSADTTTQIRPR